MQGEKNEKQVDKNKRIMLGGNRKQEQTNVGVVVTRNLSFQTNSQTSLHNGNQLVSHFVITKRIGSTILNFKNKIKMKN